jgi:hypothetical protein
VPEAAVLRPFLIPSSVNACTQRHCNITWPTCRLISGGGPTCSAISKHNVHWRCPGACGFLQPLRRPPPTWAASAAKRSRASIASASAGSSFSRRAMASNLQMMS